MAYMVLLKQILGQRRAHSYSAFKWRCPKVGFTHFPPRRCFIWVLFHCNWG